MGGRQTQYGKHQLKVLNSVICDHAGSTPDGKLDLHGVFHDLYAPGFPAQQGQMTLVLVVEWDRNDHGRFQFRVDMMGPDAQTALTVEGHSDVSDPDPTRPPPRTQLVMPLENAIFPEPGEYRFEIRIKGQNFPGPVLHLMQADEATGAAD